MRMYLRCAPSLEEMVEELRYVHLLHSPSLEELVEEPNLSWSYVARISFVLLQLRSWWRRQTCLGVMLHASPLCFFTGGDSGEVKLVPELRSVHAHVSPLCSFT